MSSLIISIYRRADKRASVVFRKNKALYRITTVEYAPTVVRVFRGYEDDLKKNAADPKSVFEILCPRKRNRVVEIGLRGEKAHLHVYEAAGEDLKPCFKWSGRREELRQAVGQFTLMAFMSRY